MDSKDGKELRELDACIAEHVMGWTKVAGTNSLDHPGRFTVLADRILIGQNMGARIIEYNPTADPAAAMAVLEKCVAKCDESGDSVDISISTPDGGFEVGRMQVGFEWNIELNTKSKTLPLAICLFAKQLFSK